MGKVRNRIASCPSCNRDIFENHPYAWCIECGERFPREFLLKNPGVHTPPLQPEPQPPPSDGPIKYKNDMIIGSVYLFLFVVILVTYIFVYIYWGFFHGAQSIPLIALMYEGTRRLKKGRASKEIILDESIYGAEYVLYLRGFSLDKNVDKLNKTDSNRYMTWEFLLFSKCVSKNIKIIAIEDRRYGNFGFIPRIELGDKEWLAEVERLMLSSKLIIFIPTQGSGVIEELTAIKKLDLICKTIFLIPEIGSEANQFLDILISAFGDEIRWDNNSIEKISSGLDLYGIKINSATECSGLFPSRKPNFFNKYPNSRPEIVENILNYYCRREAICNATDEDASPK